MERYEQRAAVLKLKLTKCRELWYNDVQSLSMMLNGMNRRNLMKASTGTTAMIAMTAMTWRDGISSFRTEYGYRVRVSLIFRDRRFT
jgi:hypothetical protein